jgi:hypothetical protein
MRKRIDEMKPGFPIKAHDYHGIQQIYKRLKAQQKRDTSFDDYQLGILDLETDPFDNVLRKEIKAFHCTVYMRTRCDDYYRQFWNEDEKQLIYDVLQFLQCQPKSLIYAHNGGRFDYLKFMGMIRDKAVYKNGRLYEFKMKGMDHIFRDSYPLVPMKLEQFNKDVFDYAHLKKDEREQYRTQIVRYCLSDCVNLMELIVRLHEKWGRKALTIGQVAKRKIKELYDIGQLGPQMDAQLRPFFRGGFCGLLAGPGVFASRSDAPIHNYDVNSMYPYTMAHFEHPTGAASDYYFRTAEHFDMRHEHITEDTCFLDLTAPRGSFLDITLCEPDLQPDEPELARYRISIHEWKAFDAAKAYCHRDIRFHVLVDCVKRQNFRQFVEENYAAKKLASQRLVELDARGQKGTREWYDQLVERESTKLLLNNAYGKFAEDPSKYEDYFFYSDSEDHDCTNDQLAFRYPLADSSWLHIYRKPSAANRYFNVGTAASITGAARAVLMQAIDASIDPLYCDTDSLINRGFKHGVDIMRAGIRFDDSELGAWKYEGSIDQIAIVARKLYSWRGMDGKNRIKAKGANTYDLTHEQMCELALDPNKSLENWSRAPRFRLDGRQEYILRHLRQWGTKAEYDTG